MNIDPIISVITICKNAEKTISGTMESVLNQTYPNIEYIIVDGKSTDNTLNIAYDIAKKYKNKKINFFSEEDSGISDAMNKGILLSSGKILNHLHAGDRYISDFVIEKVVDSYIKNNWRWGVAGTIVVDSDKCQKHVFKPQSDYKVLLKKNCIPHQSTFLIRDIFNKHGLFRVDYKQAMDYEYWLRIAFKGRERYQVLPFNTTYFLDSGKSSDIIELLKYSYRLRKKMEDYNCKISKLSNVIFLVRIFLFHVFYRFKRKIC